MHQMRTVPRRQVSALAAGRYRRLKLSAHTLQRRVGLDVRGSHDQPLGIKQASVAAGRKHLYEQLVQHRRVGEPHSLRAAERCPKSHVRHQTLALANARS